MLSIDQKAHILRRAGVAVPARQSLQMAAQQGSADANDAAPRDPDWVAQVERLHASHALDRARRSLFQAEAALQLGATPHPGHVAPGG